MADGPTDPLRTEEVAGTDASGLVRARIEALIAAARELSHTCADLADALRPAPGSDMDDPLTTDFGRLRAEHTAALLDEAALAARGTFGLLDAAHGALDQATHVVPESGAPHDGQPAASAFGGPPADDASPTGGDDDVSSPGSSPFAVAPPVDAGGLGDGSSGAVEENPYPVSPFAVAPPVDAGGLGDRDSAAVEENPAAGSPFATSPFATRPFAADPGGVSRDGDSGAVGEGSGAVSPFASPFAVGTGREEPTGGSPFGVPEEQVFPPSPVRASTWPDAFLELPPRSVGPEDEPEEDLAAAARLDQFGGTDLGAHLTPDASADDQGQPVETEGTDGLAAVPAALAGWVVVDPDDEDGSEPVALEHRPTGPLPALAASAAGPTMLTVHTDRDDDGGYAGDFDPDPFGEAASSEPRSLTLVPPLQPNEIAEPEEIGEAAEPEEALGGDPLAPDLLPVGDLPTPFEETALEATGSGPWVPEAEWEPAARSIWAVEPPPGGSAAGDGLAVFPLDEPDPEPETEPDVRLTAPETPAEAALPPEPVDDPGAAVVSRQVEAARRHLQAALVVANGTAAPQLGALLTAVEQVLTAVTDLARETRGVLEATLAERTFPGEARFLCTGPWETAPLVGREAYADEAAAPAGLAKLLRALGYDARSVTSASGVAGVQVRSDRYAAHVALVEPAGGGRQRWSGALEWTDPAGESRTWAETLGPVDLEEEELARRVDELLRRSVGPAT